MIICNNLESEVRALKYLYLPLLEPEINTLSPSKAQFLLHCHSSPSTREKECHNTVYVQVYRSRDSSTAPILYLQCTSFLVMKEKLFGCPHEGIMRKTLMVQQDFGHSSQPGLSIEVPQRHQWSTYTKQIKLYHQLR